MTTITKADREAAAAAYGLHPLVLHTAKVDYPPPRDPPWDEAALQRYDEDAKQKYDEVKVVLDTWFDTGDSTKLTDVVGYGLYSFAGYEGDVPIECILNTTATAIAEARTSNAKLLKIRNFVEERLKLSQMMRPVAQLLQQLYTILEEP